MLAKLNRDGKLYQETIVYEISTKFGERFTFINENGNLAIGKTVLTAFRSISEDSVVWDRGDKAWRNRESFDQPGRQQD